MLVFLIFTLGVDRDSTSASANLQLFVWIFSGIILVNVYTGFLVASITAYEAPPPFTDLKSMVEQTEYTFGMFQGAAFFRWMNVRVLLHGCFFFLFF